MEKRKILIADTSESFCQALSDTLCDNFRVRCCTDGNQVLQIMKTFRADVMILDLMLSGVDGITLLQKIAQSSQRPMVLATTRYVSQYVLDAAERLGIGYLMMKPCEAEAVAVRVMDMTQRMKSPVFASPDPKIQVSNMLLGLGFSTKLRGYGYLRDAVLLMSKNAGQSITKELYPTVAGYYGVTAQQVERSIRNAVQNAWQYKDGTSWQCYFPSGKSGSFRRPSNGALISCLAEKLLARENAQ